MNKLEKLKDVIRPLGSVLIGFSGGVDSTLLLKVCVDTLGRDRVLAVTVESEIHPEFEKSDARELARAIGARWMSIPMRMVDDRTFSSNPPDRCYYCKLQVFSKLRQIAKENGIEHVLDGTNLDDLGDWRPGMKATSELGIISPLREAGLVKSDIRELSRDLGLPTASKPSMACLASRFPYGTRITEEELRMVDKAETRLREIGFENVRVRHHGKLARIEVSPSLIAKIASDPVRSDIVACLKEIGYVWVSVDLQGYRTGSLNEELRSD